MLAAEPEIWIYVKLLVLLLSTVASPIRRASPVGLTAPALAGVCPSHGGALQALPMSVLCMQATCVFKSQPLKYSFQI